MDNFRFLLLKIAQELTREDLNQLKFLCSGFIPAGKAEFIGTPQDLFLELERRGKLSKDNRDFLADCLVGIGRVDLRNKLVESRPKSSHQILSEPAFTLNTSARSEERDNFFCLFFLLLSFGTQKLREYFKRQWPIVYQRVKPGVTPPPWQDTPADAAEMKKYETKKFLSTPHIMAKFNSGNTNDWDFVLLYQVLTYSSLGFVLPGSPESRALDDLRAIRNSSIAHVRDTTIPTAVFNTEWKKACNALTLFNATAADFKAVQDDGTVPPEILTRGPEALKAYEEALNSGKTKNRRLLVSVLGPARAGKTSLLRSLNGETFDSEEDSTTGVQLLQTFCKPKEKYWSKDITEDISYTNCMADAICKNLRESDIKQPDDEIQKNLSALSLGGGDDGGDGDDSDDHDHDKEDESLKDETKTMENQKAIREESTLNLPKSIEEKLLAKLKNIDIEKTEGIELYLKTLDFAGQAVYDVIHPIFLTLKAIYILVYNLENNLHDQMVTKVKYGCSERELANPFEMTNLENLEFWLSCISTYTDVHRKSKIGKLSLPLVFIACTHADKFAEKPEAAKEIVREIYRSLSPSKKLCGNHVVRNKIYIVNNTLSGNREIKDESVRNLKADVEEVSKSLPQMDENIPIKWLWFEEELSNLLVKEKKKYITIEEALKIASKCKVNTETNEFKTLLNYLHDLKTIIYFEETKLVFIDTQWLASVFASLITVKPVEEWDGFDEFWEKLEEEGVLERALVEHVWKDMVDDNITVVSLLSIMEKFSLVCRWKLDGQEVYLVPSMLVNSKKTGTKNIETLLGDQKSSTMVIRFKSWHLPLGIFPRVFVAIAEQVKREWPNARQPKLCQNFCRFYNVGKEGRFDIFIRSGVRTISLTVYNKQNMDGQLVTDFCQSMRSLLSQILDGMRRNHPWMQSMEVEYGIRCPVCTKASSKCKSHKKEGCTKDSCFHFVTEKDLKGDRPECYEDDESLDNLIEKKAYSHWFTRTNEQFKEHSAEMGNDGSKTSVMVICPDLVACVEVKDIHTICPVEAAKKIAEYLKLDKTSLNDPPDEIVKKCRTLCIYLKAKGRLDIVKRLKTKLPSGVTGPCLDENGLYEELNYDIRLHLTQSLCGEEQWKRLANEVGISNSRLSYFNKKDNPAEAVLEEYCKASRLTVGDLYDMLIKCSAAALADEYL